MSNRGTKEPIDECRQTILASMPQKDQEIREGIPIIQDHQTDLDNGHIPKDLRTFAIIKN